MKTTMFSFFMLLSTFIFAQIVSIPDANFKAKLLASSPTNFTVQNLSGAWFKLDSNNDGEIQETEANQVSYMHVPSSMINSLEGIKSFSNIHSLFCFSNLLRSLDVSNLTNLKLLRCHGNLFTTINVTGCINLEELTCHTNYNLTTLNLTGLVNLKKLDVNTTRINPLVVSGLTRLEDLHAGWTYIPTVDLTGLISLKRLDLSATPSLTSLDISTNVNLTNLAISDANILSLDASRNRFLSFFSIYNLPKLVSVNIKNGLLMNENSGFAVCPKLRYVCADALEIPLVQTQVPSNCVVSSYCTFTPGGNFNTITGRLQTCNATDNLFIKHSRIRISDGLTEGSTFSNKNGVYTFYTGAGNFTITPLVNYYVATPLTSVINFENPDRNYRTQDFCFAADGIKNDLEVKIIPRSAAVPGFNSYYRIIYKNKGNTTQNGSVNFSFNNNLSAFISSSIAPNSTAVGLLSWNFVNLKPFEEKTIDITLKQNPSTHATFPLAAGNILNFNSVIVSGTDEIPLDNQFRLNQTVVSSFDPNDKSCLQGNSITSDMIGKYVDYVIRFENNGTANAQFIVVKDLIDTALFDVSTLEPINASHDYHLTITDGNKVEFYFEDIQLPFDDANNDGFIAFKIKTKNTLKVGDVLKNKADIYFDYNIPIQTKEEVTKIENLSNEEFSNLNTQIPILFSPNPATDKITFSKEVKPVSIFDLTGKLVQSSIINGTEMNVSSLQNGTYILKISTENGNVTEKLIKR